MTHALACLGWGLVAVGLVATAALVGALTAIHGRLRDLEDTDVARFVAINDLERRRDLADAHLGRLAHRAEITEAQLGRLSRQVAACLDCQAEQGKLLAEMTGGDLASLDDTE